MSVDKRISSKLAPVAAMPSGTQAKDGPQVGSAPATGTAKSPNLRKLLGTTAAEIRYPALVFALSFAGFLLVRGVAVLGKSPDALLRWDATWYRAIADRGYFTDGNPYIYHNVSFFPLYPMVSRLVKGLLSLNTEQAMLVVSAASTLLALILLYKVLLRHCTELTARATLALLAFHPFAVFFYNGYTESLFLLLISTFFYFLINKEWSWAAAITVGLASAVRPYGCLLSIVFAFELLRRHHRDYGFRLDLAGPHLRQALLWMPVCFAGLMAYTAWLGYKFDEPMAFSHNMAAWGASAAEGLDWTNLLTFKHVGAGLVLALATQPWTGPVIVGLSMFMITPLLLLAGYKRIHPAFSFFLLLMFLFFHLVDHHDPGLVNIGRHLLVVFPLVVLVPICLDPRAVERFLDDWTVRETTTVPCMCWRFICSLPLLAAIIVFGWLYLQNILRFYHGEFI